MDSEHRNKRDLPEVVAEILITMEQMQQQQSTMQQTLLTMQQTMQTGFEQMTHSFNSMTNAVLDAMSRQTDRYNGMDDARQQQQNDLTNLTRRVDALEQKADRRAS